jgi:hypothetical protein
MARMNFSIPEVTITTTTSFLTISISLCSTVQRFVGFLGPAMKPQKSQQQKKKTKLL